MLLYPDNPGEARASVRFGMAQGDECLSISTIDVSMDENQIIDRLRDHFNIELAAGEADEQNAAIEKRLVEHQT